MKYIRIPDGDMEWTRVEGNILNKDGKCYRIVGFEQSTKCWILAEE